MKKYTVYACAITILMTFFLSRLQAQAANETITFANTFGGPGYEIGFCLYPTSDRGYILSGQSKSYFGATKGLGYLIKTDSAGNQQWMKLHGGNLAENGANTIIPTDDGGYFATGHTEAWGNGECDAWVLKTGANGDSVWSGLYGYAWNDVAYDGIQLNDGSYLSTGLVSLPNDTAGNAFIAKYSGSGSLLWLRTYGGPRKCYTMRILACADGSGFIATGLSLNDAIGPEQIWVFKTDNAGNLVWSKNIGGPGYSESFGLIETRDGNYMVAGFTTSYGLSKEAYMVKRIGSFLGDRGYRSDEDAYLVKLAPDGDLIWTRSYGGSGADRAYSVAETADGGFFVAGYTKSYGDTAGDAMVVRTDAQGNELWMKTYGKVDLQDQARWIIATADGGFAFTGLTYSWGHGDADLFFVKADSDGNVGAGIHSVMSEAEVKMFPNPAHDFCNLQCNSTAPVNYFSVFDLNGKEVMHYNNPPENFRLNTSALPEGVYLVKICDTKGITSVKKLIKD